MARVRYDPSLFDDAPTATATPARTTRIKYDPTLFEGPDFSNVQADSRTGPDFSRVRSNNPELRSGPEELPWNTHPALERPVEITAPPPRTWGDLAQDRMLAVGKTGLGILGGVASEAGKEYPFLGAREMSAIGALGGRFGWDYGKKVSDAIEAQVDQDTYLDQVGQTISEQTDRASEQQSDRERFNERQLGKAWQGGLGTTAKYLVENPGQALALGFDSIPYMAGSGAVGAGLRAAGTSVGVATAGGLGTEVALTSQAAAEQARAEIQAMPPEELAKLPDFDRLAGKYGESGARRVLASRAANVARASQAVIGAATAGATSKLAAFERAAAGAERTTGRLRAFGEGVGKESLQEGVQGAGEQVSQNIGVGAADPTRGVGEGVAQGALLEATAGGPIGGVAAAIAPVQQRTKPADPAASAGAKAAADALRAAMAKSEAAAAPAATPIPEALAGKVEARTTPPVEQNVPQDSAVDDLLVEKAREQFDAQAAAELAQARAQAGDPQAPLPPGRAEALAAEVAEEFGIEPAAILRQTAAERTEAPAPAVEPAEAAAAPEPVQAAQAVDVGPVEQPGMPEAVPAQVPEAEPEAEAPSLPMRSTREESEAFFMGNMRNEIGWDQRGGRLIRTMTPEDVQEGAERGTGEVEGRTTWEPRFNPFGDRSAFWRTRPDQRMTEAQGNAAFDAFERGDPLTPRQQRLIDHARKFAAEYAEDEEAAQREGHAVIVEADSDGVRATVGAHPDLEFAGRMYDRSAYSEPDNAESRTAEDWTRAALEAGVTPEQIERVIEDIPFNFPTRADQVRELARLIQERGNAGRQGQGQAVPAGDGRGAAEVEGGRAAEAAEGAAGAEGQDRPLRSQGPDLFAAPTTGERVRAAGEAVDQRLRGGNQVATTMRQGAGELFAGPRPEQARIPDAKPQATGPARVVMTEAGKAKAAETTLRIEAEVDGQKLTVVGRADRLIAQGEKRVKMLRELLNCVRSN